MNHQAAQALAALADIAAKVYSAGAYPAEITEDYEPTADDLAALRDDEIAQRDGGTFASWLADQASYYRTHGTPRGDWAAALFERQAQLLAWTGATGPAQLAERIEAQEELAQQDHYLRGYADGRTDSGA